MDSLFKCSSLTEMPTGRVFNTAVAYGKNIYVLGGCDMSGSPITSAECLDLSTNSWTNLPDLPTPKAASGGIVADDKIFTIGGVCGDKNQVNAVEAFDPRTEKWISYEPLKEPLQNITPIIRGDKVFIVGGLTGDMQSCTSLQCFDPRRNKWQTFPALSTPRYSVGIFLVDDNKLYVLCGRHGKQAVNDLEMFDLRTFKWTTLPPCPGEKRVFASYFQHNQLIGIIAGLRENPKDGFSPDVDIFDIEKEEWFKGPRLHKARGDMSSGILNDHLIVAGGFGLSKGTETCVEVLPLSNIRSYNYVEDDGDDTSPIRWNYLHPCMTSPHASCGHVTFDQADHAEFNGLYMFGGMTPQKKASGQADVVKTISNLS